MFLNGSTRSAFTLQKAFVDVKLHVAGDPQCSIRERHHNNKPFDVCFWTIKWRLPLVQGSNAVRQSGLYDRLTLQDTHGADQNLCGGGKYVLIGRTGQ